MSRKSQIYTGGGDSGKTSLIGGKRVPKFHLRIEAYGTVDELMAQTSLLRDMVEDGEIRDELLTILEVLMASASVLASDCEDCPVVIPHLQDGEVRFLEDSIDRMDAGLPALTSFIIPGGHVSVSQAHVVRTVCRRCERCILQLNEVHPVSPEILRFYNRLSDYFFVLSRRLAQLLGLEQAPWKCSL